MAGKSKAIEEVYNQCKLELKKIWNKRRDRKKVISNNISKGVRVFQKLPKIYRVTRTTLMKWIARFKEKGIIRFAIQPERGPKQN